MGNCSSYENKEMDAYVEKRLKDPDTTFVRNLPNTKWNENDLRYHFRNEFNENASYGFGTPGADLRRSGYRPPGQPQPSQFYWSRSDSSSNSSRSNEERRVSYSSSDSSSNSSRGNEERRDSYSSSDSSSSNSVSRRGRR